jgi:hypothetical protein
MIVRKNLKGVSQAESHRSQTSCSSESTKPLVVAMAAVVVRGRGRKGEDRGSDRERQCGRHGGLLTTRAAQLQVPMQVGKAAAWLASSGGR